MVFVDAFEGVELHEDSVGECKKTLTMSVK